MKYSELVQIRKNYDFSKLGTNRNGKKLLNPEEIYDNYGNLIQLNEVNPWSLWQGDLSADILLIGQDFSCEKYYKDNRGKDDEKSKTNNRLIELFKLAGIDVINPKEQYKNRKNQNLFFTNCIAGIKEGNKMNEEIPKEWVKDNAKVFLKPLIDEILKPKIIITLGKPAFEALNYICDLYTDEKLENKYTITQSFNLNDVTDNNPFYMKNTVVFAFFHCSYIHINRKGIKNGKEQEEQDWQMLASYTDKLNNK